MIIKRTILIAFLITIIFISGCVEQNGEITPEYKDEALKIEIELTEKVLPGQGINMKVYVRNQVKDEIKNVMFRVTDFYGLDLINQVCPGDAIRTDDCGFGITKCGCGSFNIQSLDEIEMGFLFKVPTKEEISRIGGELKPEFTLSYDYLGETTYFIPIIGLSEKSTLATTELAQTKGPIHVNIERGFTSSTNSWERSGSGFSIVVDVKDVINPKNDMSLYNRSFEMRLSNLNVNPSFGICDFTEISGVFYPRRNITLPMETPLICAIVGDSRSSPWLYGQVTMNYDYKYEIVKTRSVIVETVID